MDESVRNTILAAAEELFDRERLFKLASSVGEARSRKGLRFWQETMLAELTEHCGIDVTPKASFIAVFKGTKERYAPPKPDKSPAGMLKTMQAIWLNAHEMEKWVRGASHELSKIGTLESYVGCYRALAKFLSADQVVELYKSLRDQSMRSESEWRHEFLKYFKKTVTKDDLPEPFHDDHWIQQADGSRSFPFDLFTGLSRDD